jgi:hypothetical protein
VKIPIILRKIFEKMAAESGGHMFVCEYWFDTLILKSL